MLAVLGNAAAGVFERPAERLDAHFERIEQRCLLGLVPGVLGGVREMTEQSHGVHGRARPRACQARERDPLLGIAPLLGNLDRSSAFLDRLTHIRPHHRTCLNIFLVVLVSLYNLVWMRTHFRNTPFLTIRMFQSISDITSLST